MYSKEAILNMIDNYQMTLITVIPDCDSNSIAQYGIQATLPKPQGQNSSKVEDTVIRRENEQTTRSDVSRSRIY